MVTLKLIYLIVLAIALFLPRDPLLLGLLLGAHVLLWLFSGLSARELWAAVRRLRWFLLIIFISYALISTPDSRWFALPVGSWELNINLAGLQTAVLMCARVLTLVITSAWVRRTSPAGAFVDALRRIGIPQTVAVGVDSTLDMLADTSAGHGNGGGRGGGKGRRKKRAQESGNGAAGLTVIRA